MIGEKNRKIASTKVLAILFMSCLILKGQTGTIKLYLVNKDTKTPLASWKTTVYLNDSLLTSESTSDSEGLIQIKNVKQGKYNILVKPFNYVERQINDIMIYDNKPTYLNFSFEQDKPVRVKWRIFKNKKRKDGKR